MEASASRTRPAIQRVVPSNIRFLLQVYGLGIGFFTLFRTILVLNNLHHLKGVPFGIVLEAYLMGFRFDTVISGYLLVLPLILTSILDAAHTQSKVYERIVFFYLFTVYTLAFAAGAADIPYFNYYSSRLTYSIFGWSEAPGIAAKAVFLDSQFYPFMLLFLAAVSGWYILLRRTSLRWYDDHRSFSSIAIPRWKRVPLYLLGAVLLFIGIRGRISAMSPIRWGTAFFSSYAFPNQMGLNPLYTLIRSTLDAQNQENNHLHLMPDAAAISNVRQYLHIADSPYDSPIARIIPEHSPVRRFNVVLVLMESMSAAKMGIFGRTPSLTPNLDSLARQSVLFTNFYSAGIHTHNGIFSTIHGFPALMYQRILKSTEAMQVFPSLGNVLHDKGYQTLFVCPHDEQFDNIGGFLANSGFENIVSQKDFEGRDILTFFGVPDGVLFEHALPAINHLHEKGGPFLTLLLTCTDHGPYQLPNPLPPGFVPHSTDQKQRCTEYADWSIGQFINNARKQPWYDSTIFVFVADHGLNLDPLYDMDMAYHHIPLIIHCPALFKEGQTLEQLGGQVDVFPTIMGLLGYGYVNNTLGIDLLREHRPYAYFSADDKIGCVNDKYFYILRDNGKATLYDYRARSTEDHLAEFPHLADSMKTYAQSMVQTTQWMIANRKIAVRKK